MYPNRSGHGKLYMYIATGCLSGHPVVYLVGLLCNQAGQSPAIQLCIRSSGCATELVRAMVAYLAIRLCIRSSGYVTELVGQRCETETSILYLY